MHQTPFVIVGAGQAGSHAAFAMREAGFAGRVLLIGEEAERPYERPPLSKEMLTGEPEPAPPYFHPAERYPERSIELLLHTRVTGIDPPAHLVHLHDGTEIAYGKLLLATGGRARRLPIEGGRRILYLRTLEDARRIRARLVAGTRVACIGAGVIGLEIASSARARGCEVTVIEAGPTPMGRCVSPEIADFIARLHRQAGVVLHFNAVVEAIDDARVICAGGLCVQADCIVAGVGMERNTALAEQAGLAMDGGVVVDEHARASAPDVYAAGDVAAFWHPGLQRRLRLESWRHAQNHGIAAGRSMAGMDEPYDEVPWFWTDQHGVNVQVAGLPDTAVVTVMRGADTDRAFSAFHLAADGRLVAATGVNSPREVRIGQSLIQAGRIIDPTVLADPKAPLQRLLKAAA